MTLFDDVFIFAVIAELLELNINRIYIYHFNVSLLFLISFFLYIMDLNAFGTSS